MRRKLVLPIAGAFLVSLLAASSASAATEFGDDCSANGVVPGVYTLTTLTGSGGIPPTAPSAGVITQVKVNLALPLPFAVPTTVKVLRSAGGNSFTVINQVSLSATSGATVADARLPVQAGDRLAIHGEPFTVEGSPLPGYTFYCAGVPGSLGILTANPQPGATVEFTAGPEDRIPVSAILEPDADGDGYGDETQDKCPQSAAVQVACPVIVLDSYPIARKSSILVLIAANESSVVTVSGSAKLPKAKKARSSATAKLKGVTKSVTAGQIARVTLKLPGKLKSALRKLPHGRKIAVKLQASATNVAGQVSNDNSKLKLKG